MSDDKYDYRLIAKDKNDILQLLNYSSIELKALHKSLKYYRYIDKIDDFENGYYVRWINVKKSITLTKGAFLMNILIIHNEIHLLLKTIFHRKLLIKVDDCIVFQKLSNQELIIIQASM
jgi:hypothetical protein